MAIGVRERDEDRSEKLQFRVTPGEREAALQRARETGLSLSDYLRMLIDRDVQRVEIIRKGARDGQ